MHAVQVQERREWIAAQRGGCPGRLASLEMAEHKGGGESAGTKTPPGPVREQGEYVRGASLISFRGLVSTGTLRRVPSREKNKVDAEDPAKWEHSG